MKGGLASLAVASYERRGDELRGDELRGYGGTGYEGIRYVSDEQIDASGTYRYARHKLARTPSRVSNLLLPGENSAIRFPKTHV